MVGAVPEHLACDVEAFEDVERRDHGQSRVRGWGGHHVVTYGRTPAQQQKQNTKQEMSRIKALIQYRRHGAC